MYRLCPSLQVRWHFLHRLHLHFPISSPLGPDESSQGVNFVPLLSYFSVVVCLRCLLYHILSLIAYRFWENREFVFIIIVQFMMTANIRMRFGLQIVLVCLYSTPSHYHHYAYLSEGIELIKCQSDIFCRVCKIKHILSVIHYTICGVVCFQFTHFSCDN